MENWKKDIDRCMKSISDDICRNCDGEMNEKRALAIKALAEAYAIFVAIERLDE